MANGASSIAAARARATSALRRPHNWVQLGKFCTVGAVGYIVNLAVYTWLVRRGLHYNVAAAFSFLVAARAGKVVAQAIAIVLVTPINFVGNKLWSFRRR